MPQRVAKLLGGALGPPLASVRKASRQTPYQFPPGSYTFKVPKSGYWKFVLWGPGAIGSNGDDGGGSGAYCEITKPLASGQSVALVVGSGSKVGISNSSGASTATFPDGNLTSAGTTVSSLGGTGVAAVASGGDVNLNGSLGGQGTGGTNTGAVGSGTGGGAGGVAAGANGGGGAPANLPFRGGAGGSAGSTNGRSPGGGASSVTGMSSGDGQIIAFLVRE